MGHGRYFGACDLEQIYSPELRLLVSQLEAKRLVDRRDKQHIGAFSAHLEVVCDSLSYHRWCKRPERFPVFDFEVHYRLHLVAARVTDYAAASQCPRTELHPSLKPADNLLFDQLFGYSLEELLVGQSQIGCLPLLQEAFDLLIGEFRTEEGPFHGVYVWASDSGGVEIAMGCCHRDTESATGIAGSWLNPYILERPLTQYSAVADAVERYTTSQAE